MNVTIKLSTEVEVRLREKASERGTTLEDYLSELAVRWASEADGPAAKSVEQRLAEFKAFVASHNHITAVADDSRESMYEGCGE